ncbi:General transcription factor 3C polypeptide 5 [Halotydeus destructor]|nr:General transcription factor 3C polypeptide 5 [Halotydeus destructor]
MALSSQPKNDNVKSLVCVEYPGIVENLDNALESLGGLQSLERTYNQGTDRLELRFRPSDVYSHGTFGDRTHVNNLLVKFKRIRKKLPDGSWEERTESSVVGVMATCYEFKTMADFQYLPMKKAEKEDTEFKYEDISEELTPLEGYEKGTASVFKETAPLLVLPTIFSRFDAPSDYVYKGGPKHRDQKLTEETERQQNLAVLGRSRRSRAIAANLIYWVNEIPMEAGPEVMEIAKKYMVPDDMLKKLDELFKERPIWSKAGLAYRLKCPKIDLKYTLPCKAYYYHDGPFRCLWIKFGFNPKLDKSSAMYQSIDFRLRSTYTKNEGGKDLVAPKRSVYSYQLPLTKGDEDKSLKSQRRLRPTLSTEPTASTSQEDKDKECEENLLAQFIFKAGIVPTMRMLIYQMTDIQVDEIQMMLSTDDLSRQECSEKDGWFEDGTMEKVRIIMNEVVSETLGLVVTPRKNDARRNVDFDDDTNPMMKFEFTMEED